MNIVHPVLIYCYDAYCGWCYGMSDNIQKIKKEFAQFFDFEILSGGMLLPEAPVPVADLAPAWLESIPTITSYSGAVFGNDFLWHMNQSEQSDWFPNSLKPAIALIVIKELNHDIAFDFAKGMQYGLFFEGRDLTDDAAYLHLLEQYQIDPDTFYGMLHDPAMEEKARYEFALVKQLKVTGYPTILLQVSQGKFYLVANGYTHYDDIKARLENILGEMSN